MQQGALWIDDIYEALRTDIMACGGYKVVGAMLWPEKDPHKAGDYLSTCINRTRNEKLDPEQVLFIIREARKHASRATISYSCDSTGYTQPAPIEPEDQATALQREFIEAKNSMEQLVKRMERLALPVRAVKS